MALLLSQCMGIGVLTEIPISERNLHSQYISRVVSAIARYSASVLDRETTSCLLLHQEMREVPKKIQYPAIDRRVSGLSAHPASEYARRVSRSWRCIGWDRKRGDLESYGEWLLSQISKVMMVQR